MTMMISGTDYVLYSMLKVLNVSLNINVIAGEADVDVWLSFQG